jgi:hypothetical protein
MLLLLRMCLVHVVCWFAGLSFCCVWLFSPEARIRFYRNTQNSHTQQKEVSSTQQVVHLKMASYAALCNKETKA